MIKQMVTGLIYIIIITVLLTPVTFVISGYMETVMAAGLLTTIMVTLVKYFGFFIGIGTLKWIYLGLRQQQQSSQGYYN
jgi:hypothetical protein